ncbi:hypothetical protein M3Y97_00403500 [Aphelenchoides bicaudatus]|nr:hypothetical protein M3Y97_00403500 [Aphelenchoides bicaudatus]
MKLLFLFVPLIAADTLNEQFEKFFSDSVQFELSYYGEEELNKHYSGDSAPQFTHIYTSNNEDYKCLIPQIELNQHKRVASDYTGLTPFQLLRPLFGKQCFWRAESFWSYEFCPGKHIRQFHTEKNSKTTLEYFLGYPDFEQEPHLFDYENASKIDYGGDQVIFYPVTYTGGTPCDLMSGQPRTTKVLFVCSNDEVTNMFVSVTESSSCNYELVFSTHFLCKHYAFQPPKSNKFELKCFLNAAEDKGNRLYARPQLYDQFANDNSFNDFTQILNRRAGLQHTKATSFFDAFRSSKAKPPPTKQPAHKSKPSNAKKLPASRKLKTFERLIFEMTSKQAKKSATQTLTEFFESAYCLTGISRTGYKIKFCYRSSISMYVEDEETGEITESYVLGSYSESYQQIFAKNNPEEVKLYHEDDMYERVINMYPRGDIIDETGKEAHVETRFVCNFVGMEEHGVQLKMFFMEPKANMFLLYIESPVICDFIKKMDNIGIYRSELELIAMDVLKIRQKTEFEPEFELETLRDIKQKEGLADSVSEFELDFQDEEYMKEMFPEQKHPPEEQTQPTKQPTHKPQISKEAQSRPASRKLMSFERLTLEMTEKQAKKSASDIIQEFLDTLYCLTGISTTGYKIKFCYRNKIVMYMEDEETGEVSEAYLIGKWKDKRQELFAELNPEKTKRYDDEREMVDQVVNFYDYGEPVDASGKETSVEVRFVCKLDDLNSALNIKMFFMESTSGQFRLYLESGILCDYLQDMDDVGIYRNELEKMVLSTLKEFQTSNHKFELVDFDFQEIDGQTFEELIEMRETERYVNEQQEKQKKQKSSKEL